VLYSVIRKVHAITLRTEVTSKVLNEVLNWILCLLVVSSRWFFHLWTVGINCTRDKPTYQQ